MSKKILFMSSAKLTAFSIGLLLAVFCTIGMSFTPADEGDNVGDPNDSTYVTGPRRSHWVTNDGCNDTYNNQKDYGKVVITVKDATGGTVSASGNNSTSSTSNNNSTSVTVTWNCGYSDSKNHTDLTAKHTNKITFTANKTTGYNFEGWYSDAACTQLVKSDLSYSEDFVIGHDSWGDTQSNQYESSGSAQTWNRYAKFVEIVPVDLTFIAPGVGGSYTVTVSGSSSTVTSSNVVKTGITTEVALVATPASGYMFAGWYQMDGAGNVTDLGTTASYSKTFATSVSVGARFISTSTPKFKNITKDVEYYGLRQATMAASAGDKIIPVADCVVDGSDLVTGESYTIPAGVTLLIPYNSSNTVATTVPAKENYSGGSAPSPYRTLTLGEGVKIIVAGGGAISVASEFYGPATYSTAAAYKAGVRCPYGFIYMNSDSEIILNNGANLYAWGYITGDGEITAQNGSTVYEMMQMTDYRGGTATSGFTEGGVFPFSQYYIQNIESALHLESGATEYVRAAVTMSNSPYPATAKLIGASGALFNISSGVLTKKYDRLSDRLLITMNGNGSLASMALKFTGLPLIGSIDLNTGDYVLPLNSNMRIEVASGKTLTLSQDLAVLPGVEVHISTGAKLLISSGYKMYAYDMAEWVGKGYVYPSLDIKPLNYVARNHVDVSGTPRSRSLANAKIIVDGGIEATGSFFTTESGADICSTLGSNGYIKLVSKAPTNTNTQQATQSGTDVTRKNIPVTSAQLHNASQWYTAPYTGENACEYLATTGSAANTTITYANGHWGWIGIWKDYDGTILKVANTCLESQLAANAPADPTRDPDSDCGTYTFSGWTASRDATLQEIIYTAEYSSDSPNYTVTWKNADGTVLETDADVPCGSLSSYDAVDPTKAADAQYTYTFDGWATEENGAKVYEIGATPNVSADVTYFAHFALTINTYTVTWKNADGTTLETDENVPYGTTPTYDGATPAKTSTATDVYTFAGWNSEIAAVTGDATYTATYTSVPPVVSVTVSGNTTYYATIDAAFAYVNTVSANMTIKLLQDVSAAASLVYQPKSTYTCTLDLNNHTISGTFTKLINVNLKNAVLTITDNTTEKGGKIHTEQSLNDKLYGLFITAGKVNLNAGTIECVNTLQYNSTSAKSVSAYGVYVYSSSARHFTMSGGTVKANATYNAFGVYSAGTTNLQGGKIEVSDVVTGLTRNGTGYGVYVAGATTTISDDADISVNTKTVAYGVYIKAAAAVANITGGEILAKTASTKTAYGIYVHTGTFNAPEGSTTHVTADAYTTTAAAIGIGASGTVNIYDGTYEAKNTKSTGTTTYGVYSSGTTNIHGGTFNVTAKTSTARAIGVWRNTTTVDGAPEFNVSAPATVYGATAAGSTPTKAGAMYSGTLIVNGGTFNVTATSGETAYGVYAYAGTGLSMFSTTNDSVPGNYISAGKVNVSDGIFNVKAKTKAYGIVVGNGTQNKNTAYDPLTAYGQSSITGGKFKVETTGDANATAYAMNKTATADNLVIEGGYYNTKRTNASETSNIEDKYTAPIKSCNYYVLDLPSSELPYKYEVAEAYTLTWDLDGGTVTTAGTGAAVDATGAPNTIVKAGASIAAPVVTKTGYTFDGWSPAVAATMPAANTTYTATWESAETGDWLDIVGATSNTLTINANPLTLSKWPYTINGTSYGRDGKPGPDEQCNVDRTITISHDKEADEELLITVSDKSSELVSCHTYTIPHVYSVDATLSGTDENSIVFVNSGKLTVNEEQYAKAIYVSEDAELDVKGTLHVNKLVLRTVAFKAAVLTNEGTIDAEHIYYSRKVADNSQFYLFGLPLPSTTSGVILSDGSTPSSTSWQLKEYSESSRATYGISNETSNWALISGAAKIEGGKGYEIYSGSKYYREYYFPVSLNDVEDEIALSYTGNDPANSGWNVVTSLRTGIQENKPAPEGITISVLQPDGGYEQVNPTSIKPAVPFSYQASAGGKLTFESDVVSFVKTDASPAPRRRVAAAEEKERIQWIHLDVKDANSVGDQTSIYSHPTRYEQTYKTGIDVAKQSLTASRALIYSSHAYGEMAFAGVADSLLEAGVAMTVYSPSAQELTISMRDNDWLNRMEYVWLIDVETGMQINLLNSDYTFDAAEGTTRGRFFIRGQFKAPNTTTDIQNGAGIEEGARKVLIDQKIYIEVNGRLYDATGKIVSK